MDQEIWLFIIIIMAVSFIGAAAFVWWVHRYKKRASSDKPPNFEAGGTIIVITFLLLFTVGFGSIGIGAVYQTYAKEERCTVVAEAVVVDYRSSMLRVNRIGYSPVLSYQVGNQTVTADAHVKSDKKPFQIGERVTISYNPEKPSEFYIEGYDLSTSYDLGIIFIVVSLTITVIAALSLLSRRMEAERRRRLQGTAFMVGAIMIVATVGLLAVGIMWTLGIAAFFGMFALYAKYEKSRKQRDE